MDTEGIKDALARARIACKEAMLELEKVANSEMAMLKFAASAILDDLETNVAIIQGMYQHTGMYSEVEL